MTNKPLTRPGRVFLVGAGPGDPSLITLKGVSCLRRADIVLYDYLVNANLLKHAAEHAELICLGSHDQKKGMTQAEINARLVAEARQGKIVVRLKGGDPDVFGRSADEIAALTAAGIAYETIPGVTSAIAAAAYAGIPITHGDFSSAVAFVTGHERRAKSGESLDYGALASFPGTLVFYMGVTSAMAWSEALLQRGKSPDTPTAIVRRCTWPDQQTIRCTLGTVADVIAQRRLRPPAVIVVGQAVAEAPETSWFAARPLFGKRILVTRPRHQADALADQLLDLGADVCFQPAIEISEPADWRPVDQSLEDIDRFDWLVFSSSNGVSYLLDRFWSKHGDIRRLGKVKIAAIGPGTVEELLRFRLRADIVPTEYRAEALASSLASEAKGRRFLLARASRGREVLAEQLTAAGALVEQIVVYRSRDVETPDPAIAADLAAGRLDWITVTSSAIAQSLARLFGDNLHRSRLASISPITSETLRKAGFEPAVEAATYTMAGLVEAILAGRP